ncbi:MAG: adenosylcobalamin-dependent ribonucleoside-diphosphate reductase, partial [Patescibacteria group bacterium]|nr:adenosylcobalamin-dependent ribonucleoside-diphosphate reductase [Patescibacteria group bacterium]
MLDGLRLKVFNDRYALKDGNGKQLESTPEEMWRRVAVAVASVEKTPKLQEEYEEKFYKALEDFKFVPAGRILSGAGSGASVTFYNCFVIPSPEDSRGGIMDSVRTMTEIMSRGGGVGINISSLRPRGSYVKGVNGIASGSVSFGGLYSFATGLITQGGSRRGALMLVLNIEHPDIEEFITTKQESGVLTNANLSVGISDKFMEAVEKDDDWDLIWDGEVKKTVKAQYLWDLICESAWMSGEPGIVFLDRYNKQSNSWYFDKIISTNPCGEQGLPAWGVCNLGSINLSLFIDNGEINYKKLRTVIKIAVRFLDNIIGVTDYYFAENREVQEKSRRVGLGTMGLADMLIKLKLRYGTIEAIELCEKLYGFIRDETYSTSIDLAKEKGVFPLFDAEKYLKGYFINQLSASLQDKIKKDGVRNTTLLTQAPTGTTSILAGTSSGIEPIYDFVFTRKDRLGEHEVYHPLYKEYIDNNSESELPSCFVTAKELTPMEHIKMQAVIQKFVDQSISKTVNAPKTHTVQDVKNLYEESYKIGCKGVAYFREGSRDEAVLTSKQKDSGGKIGVTEKPPQGLAPRERPKEVRGRTYKIETGYGNLYVTINDDENKEPFEIFATIGKAGGFFAAKSEAICRMVSLSLRSGIGANDVITQLKGIRGPMPSWGEKGMILSIPDAIAQILEDH